MTFLHSCGRTDKGRVRAKNEDVYLARPELGLCAVADGMGGRPGGEVASRTFAEAALATFSKPTVAEERISELVRESFRLANERIVELGRNNVDLEGMGCTADLLAYRDGDYVIGHVGDSRTYLFRQGNLRQLTRDHSRVQELIDQGWISAEAARTDPARHLIVRAVGLDERLAVDLVKGRARSGDMLLLCSDGVTGMLDDIAIEQILSTDTDLERKVDRLLWRANSEGGRDNITVVLCKVSDTDHA